MIQYLNKGWDLLQALTPGLINPAWLWWVCALNVPGICPPFIISTMRWYFLQALPWTKVLNKEKKPTIRHVCLCFLPLSCWPQLGLSCLAFVLSKAFHHQSFLQHIQQILFCPSLLSGVCDKFLPHRTFSPCSLGVLNSIIWPLSTALSKICAYICMFSPNKKLLDNTDKNKRKK